MGLVLVVFDVHVVEAVEVAVVVLAPEVFFFVDAGFVAARITGLPENSLAHKFFKDRVDRENL